MKKIALLVLVVSLCSFTFAADDQAKESKATDRQLVHINEFLHPQIEELSDIAPAWLGRWMLNSRLMQWIVGVMTKKGTRMAFASFEDLEGKIEAIFFPDTYAQTQEALKRALSEAEPVILTGEVEFTEEPPKVIVRSNGTVTYVGKDIAYHLWKFGLLGRDFHYRPFFKYPNGHECWTTADSGAANAPKFGRASRVYNVVDTRQAYPQRVVVLGLRAAVVELRPQSFDSSAAAVEWK